MTTSLTTREGVGIGQPSSRFSDPPSTAVKVEVAATQQPVRHIPVAVWLNTIGLPEYLQLFEAYAGVEEILFLQEVDVKNLGVRNPGHRARIVTSLVMLRQTYEQHTAENGFTQGRLRATKSAGNLSVTAAPLLPFLGVDAAAARRLLEAELKLDSRDLRSHAWFHGAITRQQAEAMMISNGEFLVRESTSQPGDYVLTCCWNNVPLHFVVNKHVSQSGGYARVQYGFEGTTYDSVQALVMSYASEKKRVTQASGAVISQPISRTVPISLLDRYKELQSIQGDGCSSSYSNGQLDEGPLTASGHSRLPTFSSTTNGAAKRVESLPHLLQSTKPSANVATRIDNGGCGSYGGGGKRSSEDLRGSLPTVERSGSLPVAGSAGLPQAHMRGAGSEPTLLEEDARSSLEGDERAASDGDLSRPSPGKPSRLPSIKKKDRPAVEVRNKALYDDDGKDYSDYEQVKRLPGSGSSSSRPLAAAVAVDKNSNPIKAGLPQSSAILSSDQGNDDLIYDQPKAGGGAERSSFKEPVMPARYLDPAQFVTTLLPEGNKPLEPSAMYQIKEALLRKDYKLLARHVTYLDLHLLKVINSKNLGASVYSGLEAMTLPQGKHFREAVIERHYSLSYLVAVTILACTDDPQERALMLKQWVLVAAELLRSLGNLHAFCSIAEGLLHPSISRLHSTWNILRQAEPQLAQAFDAKLRATYLSLNMATSSLALGDDVSIPHVLPVAEMVEAADGAAVPPPPPCRPPVASGSAADLDILLAHLDTARFVAARAVWYHRKGDAVVSYFAPNPLLRDMFKVEFHMKLLYGYHGALANRCDRYQKFQQILAILSKRAEPYDGTEL